MPGQAIDAPPGFASRKKAVPDRIPRRDSGRETGRSEPRGPAGGGTKVTRLARSVPGLRGIGAGISAVFLPGRPGRLPAQGSHGSGRAQLRHPARPANHSHAPVARCDPPLTTASTAIRRPCVDRGPGLDVPALFPDDGRLTRKPPSLHRLRAGWPVRRLQRYYEALRLLPAHRPRLIGFAEDLPPCASDAFAPLAARWRPPGPGPRGSAEPWSRKDG